MRFLTCNAFGNRHTLIAGFMRQHRTAHHITNRPHIRQIGFAIAIYLNKAAFIFSQANGFSVQTFRIGDTTNRNNQFVKRFRFCRTIHFIRYGNALIAIGNFIQLHTQFNRQTLFFREDFKGFFGNLLVGSR